MTATQRQGQRLVISGRAPETGGAGEPRPQAPFSLVIFGASGDLTARKLLPALFSLFVRQRLPEACNIVGCSRTRMSHDEFREKMREACSEAADEQAELWPEFAARLFYHPLSYDSEEDFGGLAKFLHQVDQENNTGWNRVFYLAVPPTVLPTISGMLGRVGLTAEGEEGGWSRIVVEKPFGRDLESAMELDRILHQSFREHQIFRIDHYLAKETVQNILMLRFANILFEPVWNRSHVESVGILTAEEGGVGHRAGYYEQAGVLRDMFQNHMLQLLALIALEPPAHFEADQVRDEKAKVFRALKHLVHEDQAQNLILGQYISGKVNGRKVPAYRDEPEVDAGSLVPTFAMLRLFVNNWRWQGVPFYLASGKRLARKETRIVVQFKKVPHSMFESVLGKQIAANRLILGVYPQEGLRLTFQTKLPGPQVDLRSVTMNFNYYEQGGPALEAYEKVLLDVIQGDQMLFWRQDGVELCWAFLTPILERCEACQDRAARLQFYETGSWGPDRAADWMRMMLVAD